MSVIEAVIATTNVIDGIKLTRESLVDVVDQINGEYARQENVDHDFHYLPVGKVRSARVEDVGDISKLIVITDETRLETTTLHDRTGEHVVTTVFPNDNRPFSRQSPDDKGTLMQISVDPANFSSVAECQALFDGEEEADNPAALKLMVRRSFAPEPLIEFALNEPLLAWLLIWGFEQGRKALTYTIDQTQKRVGDALAEALSARIRHWLSKWSKRRTPDDREATVHVVIQAEPQIHLLTRSPELERDFDIGLESLCRQLDLRSDVLEEADSVTFARRDKGQEWTFLYATTKSGDVIASHACHGATLQRVEEIHRTKRICVCLKHKLTGEEWHFETTAVFMPTDYPYKYSVRFNSYPEITDEWECYAYALLTKDAD